MNIKSFIIKIWNAVRSLFNSFPKDLQKAVKIAVTITENIKNVVDSPVVDILTAIIPGDLDDKLKLALRAAIPAILSNLKLAQQNAERIEDTQLTTNGILALRDLTGDLKSAYLHNVSVLLAQITADGKLSWSDGVCIVEWYYQNKFKGDN